MADRDRRSAASLALAPKKETPGASAPGAIPILEFRNSYPRRRILSTQKRQRPYFSDRHRVGAGICVTQRIPLGSSSQSHPKRPDERVERDAQIAKIAGRPQRCVFVDADDAIKQQRRFAASLHPSDPITLIEGIGSGTEAIAQFANQIAVGFCR